MNHLLSVLWYARLHPLTDLLRTLDAHNLRTIPAFRLVGLHVHRGRLLFRLYQHAHSVLCRTNDGVGRCHHLTESIGPDSLLQNPFNFVPSSFSSVAPPVLRESKLPMYSVQESD